MDMELDGDGSAKRELRPIPVLLRNAGSQSKTFHVLSAGKGPDKPTSDKNASPGRLNNCAHNLRSLLKTDYIAIQNTLRAARHVMASITCTKSA